MWAAAVTYVVETLAIAFREPILELGHLQEASIEVATRLVTRSYPQLLLVL